MSFSVPPRRVAAVYAATNSPKPAAIDIVDFGHVQKNALPATLERIGDQLPEFLRTGSERDGTRQMQDQDVPHLPVEIFEGHAATVAPRDCRCQHFDRMKVLYAGG